MSNEFDKAIAEHDARLAASGLEVWIGGEPTFTDRSSFEPAWNHAALGADKETRARQMLALGAQRHPGALILRTIGRQYPGEESPRWSYGLYRRRDAQPVWNGPRDPLAQPPGAAECLPQAHLRARDALAGKLADAGYAVHSFAGADQTARLVFAARSATSIPLQDPRLQRSSLHEGKLGHGGPVDGLAAQGFFLCLLSVQQGCVRLELPAFHDVAKFLEFLGVLESIMADTSALVLAGFAPPVDPGIAFYTYTPDPAVVEVNMAPAPNLQSFLACNTELYADARAVGLSSQRLLYNGVVADSGGGGHITLGGRTPADSPFLRYPRLLPRLICYFNAHPSLSYLFAVDAVGSSGQSPRADEGVRESLEELQVALHALQSIDQLSPEILWHSLAPFLADRTGNTHRSEINVEKLWNPWLPGRGRLGVVEFRAFRMARTPAEGAALGALLRSIIAMLARPQPLPEDWQLKDWAGELHDRFALPCFLLQDLRGVLADLDAATFGLAVVIKHLLLDHANRELGTHVCGPCQLTLRRAVEFWPLIGDAASQESQGARLIDGSTQRIELLLCGDAPGWEIQYQGFRIELPVAQDAQGKVQVLGLRYRAFVPAIGLHPTFAAKASLQLVLLNRSLNLAYRLELHEWHPAGLPYNGLPKDEAEAANRRRERLSVVAMADMPPAQPDAPKSARTPWCIDLRQLR